jgi:carboxylesterase type B
MRRVCGITERDVIAFKCVPYRAICESGGSTVRPLSVKDMETFGEKLFAKLGVSKEPDPLATARAMSSDKIIEVDQAMNVEMGEQFVFMGPWNIAVDGWFMPDAPADIFKAGKQNAVPLITVANLGELGGPGFVVASEMIPSYVTLLTGTAKAHVNGYAAIFDQVPSNWKREGAVSAHGMELHYVFGEVDNPAPWKVLHFLYARGGAKSPAPLITDADRKVSEAMMTMWTQFAKMGDPDTEGMVKWPVYDGSTDRYLYIADPLQVKSGFSHIAQKK